MATVPDRCDRCGERGDRDTLTDISGNVPLQGSELPDDAETTEPTGERVFVCDECFEKWNSEQYVSIDDFLNSG